MIKINDVEELQAVKFCPLFYALVMYSNDNLCAIKYKFINVLHKLSPMKSMCHSLQNDINISTLTDLVNYSRGFPVWCDSLHYKYELPSSL